MIVYFLRHASAGQSKSDPVKDEKRALDEDGIEQCGYIGRALAALDVHVDVLISSPLKRASQTASLVGNEMGHEGKLVIDRALLPEAAFQAFRDLLNRHAKQEAILVVGHNPSMSEFLGKLIGDGTEASIDLKKGAVAKVEVDRKMAALHWCLTPKVVRTIYESAAASSRPKTSRK
ncbi:MAG TPA: histidine phosphatase family protein [Terriglobales bacterium]|nr:histidine phosphatase family protein [Terriglobales bacterium]